MVSPGSKYALCTAETAQADNCDRRDEDEGEGDVVLLLGGRRHGEYGRELLGVELTPTRDGHDAYRFTRRVLKTCTNEHADGAGGRRAVVSTGAQQDGRAVGTRDVPETERG